VLFTGGNDSGVRLPLGRFLRFLAVGFLNDFVSSVRSRSYWTRLFQKSCFASFGGGSISFWLFPQTRRAVLCVVCRCSVCSDPSMMIRQFFPHFLQLVPNLPFGDFSKGPVGAARFGSRRVAYPQFTAKSPPENIAC